VPVAKLLVAAGADVDHMEGEGVSALMYAAAGGHKDTVEVSNLYYAVVVVVVTTETQLNTSYCDATECSCISRCISMQLCQQYMRSRVVSLSVLLVIVAAVTAIRIRISSDCSSTGSCCSTALFTSCGSSVIGNRFAIPSKAFGSHVCSLEQYCRLIHLNC
jgi:hypothetical protein